MMYEERPDPDALLKVVSKDEAEAQKGKLRVFLGMAAGVGKTYAMLRVAQDRLREGADLVVGIAETHGRVETEALLHGLPIIPMRKIEYRGSTFEEIDIDAILARKPQLVLVDELAHTNVPGSRHPKRWQDVVELLDAGIDVYTTINVQHLESRKDAAEGITGIVIRETVPDSILERASQIELIDISPAELLRRLREGKVYLGDNAELALENFFKEDRLTALREISLRVTAEKVDQELQGLSLLFEKRAAWNTNERLLVAVSASPHSERNIRATRRLAFNLGAPWIATYVDTGANLNETDRDRLAKNLALARELGAEVITMTDPDFVQAVQRVARQKNVTHIVMGRPNRRWARDLLERGSILERLVRENSEVDIHVIRMEEPIHRKSRWKSTLNLTSPLRSYFLACGVIIGMALVNLLLLPVLGYRAVGFIFLLAVLGLSLFVSRGPILFASILSALFWDFFFIPPRGTVSISQPEDMVAILVYLVAALTTGTLTNRIRARERLLRQEDERLRMLYQLVQETANAGRRKDSLEKAVERLGEYFGGECTILLESEDSGFQATPFLSMSDKESAVAKWVFDHGKPAGWSTDTLASAEALYLPLRDSSKIVGVFVFRPKDMSHKLLPDEENLLHAAVQQLGIAVGN